MKGESPIHKAKQVIPLTDSALATVVVLQPPVELRTGVKSVSLSARKDS